MKKIVFVNQSSGYLLTDVLDVYAKEYDEVALIYGTIKENERKLDARIKLDKICAYDRSSAIGRIKTWGKAAWQIYRKLKRDYKDYEIVYVTNPPMAYLCSLRLKNPFSVIVFDTYPDALSNIGIRKGNPLFNMWAGWNRKLFLKAKRVFTLSEEWLIGGHLYGQKQNNCCSLLFGQQHVCSYTQRGKSFCQRAWAGR